MKENPFATPMIAAASNLLRPFPRLHGLIKARYYQYLGTRWQRVHIQMMSFIARAAEQEASPFFVKIGANDGVTGDPIVAVLINDRRWRGLLIEPVDYCFEKLRHNYTDLHRFTLMRVAVGDGPSVATFYYVDEAAKKRSSRPPFLV